MTLRTSLTITGDTAGAQRAVDDLARTMQRTADATDKLGASERSASAATEVLSQELVQAGTAAEELGRELVVAQRATTTLAHESVQVEGGIKRQRAAFDEGASAARRHQFAVRNAGQQVGDFGLQVAEGQDPARAFAQQIGQLGYAISEMGGTAGKVGAFLTGPWGIALTIGAALIAPLVAETIKWATANDDARDAMGQVEKAADALGQAQSVLGGIFDLTTGKLKSQNDMLRLNAELMAINFRAEAKAKESSIETAARAAVQSGGLFSNNSFGPARGLLDQVRTGTFKGTADEALRQAETVPLSLSNIDRQQLIEAIRDAYESQAKKAAADLIETALKSNTLPTELRQPARQRDNSRAIAARDEFGRDAADKVSSLTAQFDNTPAAVRQAELAIRQLDDLIDDLSRKKPPNFQATIASAQQAKQAIQASVSKPYEELIAAQRDQLAVQRLVVAGRFAEADALRLTQQLQKTMPPLLKEQQAAILGNVQAAHELAAAESVNTYVEGINDQIAALRTLDPIQREMLQVRKDLLKLAPAERGAAEARIAAAIAERDALERAAATREEVADLAHELVNSFNDIAVGGDKAGDVIKRLAQSLAAAVVQAELLGTGPLANLLGSASGARGQLGGLLGPLLGGSRPANDNPKAAATGGFFDLVGANDNKPSIAATNTVAEAIGKATGKEFDRSLGGVFGQGGAFAQTLKFGGIGYVAGGVAGSGTGGALGGIAGGFAGEKLLSGLLGSAAGPVGSIVGGLLGGLVGGLFSKPKSGTASLTGSGDATITGNSSGTRQAAGSLADQVQSGLKQIADQLGGALGGYSLAIGEFDGKYRVNTNATTQSLNYNNFNASTLHNFGDDQAGAISFAIEDAIRDGAVKGLSAAVQQALKSSGNVDDALQEALKVANLQQLLGGVSAQLDKAFSDFEKEAKERLRIAKQYGLDVVAVEKLNAKERLDLQKQLLDQQVGSLQRLIDEMTGGSLFEGTSVDRRDALLKQIDAAKADLDAGVDGAADKLAGLFEQLDQVSKDVYGTTGGFASDRQSILDQARAAIAKANADIAAAQAKASDPALATTNAALDENNDQNARMIAALEQNNALLKTIAGNTTASNDLDGLRQLARSA